MCRETAEAHAERQHALYGVIWSQDPSYGTKPSDVEDTVRHRIVPHIARLNAPPTRVIDFGAGDGRFLEVLERHCRPMSVGIGVDVYEPARRPWWMKWRKQPLWEPLNVTGDYAISTDTLEHMPPEMVPAVLANIAQTAPHGFLRISTRQDIYGTERGLHLHETVQPPEWWIEQLRAAGIEPSSWRVYPCHALEVWF